MELATTNIGRRWPESDDPNGLETIDEVAAALRISRAHVYNLIRAGKLQAVKLGTTTRVRRGDRVAFASSLPAFEVDRRTERAGGKFRSGCNDAA